METKSNMIKLAIVSLTLNAVIPLTEHIEKCKNSIDYLHYLDEGLSQKIKNENYVSEESFKRMENMVCTAQSDGADAIILSCTVFSPFLEKLRKLVNCPLIAADVAMLEKAVSMETKIAVLCTFEPTLVSTKKVIQTIAGDKGLSNYCDLYLIENAWDELKNGKKDKHDMLIKKKIAELSSSYSVFVLAQMSMSGVASQVDEEVKVLTSPSCAVAEAANRINEVKEAVK